MSKDFHSHYGPELTGNHRATNGGKVEKKDLPYSPPVGPKQSPKPTNHGKGGTQGKR